MLPLRSVGRSNFVRVCILTTLIKKRHILMRTAALYIYIYIVIFHMKIESTVDTHSKKCYVYIIIIYILLLIACLTVIKDETTVIDIFSC